MNRLDPDARERLMQSLSVADDDGLVALANRGLLRRAKKDLQTLGEVDVKTTADTVVVDLGDVRVTVPATGLADARDDSPATGVTRHVLTAILWLRDRHREVLGDGGGKAVVEVPIGTASKSDTDTPPAIQTGNAPAIQTGNAATAPAIDKRNSQTGGEVDAVVNLIMTADASSLAKWSGRTPLREAFAIGEAFANGKAADIRLHPSFKVSVNGGTVVWMGTRCPRRIGELLDQMKSTASPDRHAATVLAAVLAVRTDRGEPIRPDDADRIDLSDSIRRDRIDVSRRARRLAASIVSTGIAHVGDAVRRRLETLAVAAAAAKFPRMNRLLLSLADDVEWLIARDAQSDLARMVRRVVLVDRLARASSNPSAGADIFGESRTRYTDVGDRHLDGLAITPWRAASGYTGVTVTFWDETERDFVTLTHTRPVDSPAGPVDLSNAGDIGSAWRSAPSMGVMARNRFSVTGLKTNPDGRLSDSESTAVKTLAVTNPAGIEFGDRRVVDFKTLPSIAPEIVDVRLRRVAPRRRLRVLSVPHWGSRTYDELAGRMIWAISDASGTPAELSLEWTDENESSILFLETIDPQKHSLDSVLVNITAGGGDGSAGAGLRLEPLALFAADGKLSIYHPPLDMHRLVSKQRGLLERLRRKYGRTRTVATRLGEADQPTDAPDDATHHRFSRSIPTATRSNLVVAATVLTAAIESGGGMHDAAADRLAAAAERLSAAGMTRVAARLDHAARRRDADAILIATDALHAIAELSVAGMND